MRKLHVLAAAAAMTASSLFADVQIGKGLSVGGYIDLTYSQTETDYVGTVAGNALSGAAAGTTGASTESTGFNAATAEINFMMDFGGGLTAQVDLEGNIQSDNSTPAAGAGNDSEVAIEQARIDYAMGQGTLTLGKFDTFIGLEGLEAPDLYQISNSLTWGVEPSQHEGLAYAYDNGQFNFAVAIVNGLASDNGNSQASAANANESGDLAYAFHLGFTPSDALSLNLNYGTGGDEATSGLATTFNAAHGAISDVTLLTADASYSNHGWTAGLEYVSVEEEDAAAGAVGNFERTGFTLMVNYMFTEQFGVTGRYSTLEHESTSAAGTTSIDQDQMTLAASYAMTPNWAALIEFTTDEIDNAQETDSITLETILTF